MPHQQSEKKQLPSVDEQLTQHEKEQAEILEKNKLIAEKNCKAAQLNIEMLNSFTSINDDVRDIYARQGAVCLRGLFADWVNDSRSSTGRERR